MTSAKEIPSNIRNNFGNAYSSGDGLTLQAGVISGTVNIDRTPRKVLFPKVVYDATFDAANKEHMPGCLPGTRVEVLREIQQWIDGDSPKRLYWLNGMAGTGKSTIALTLARAYKRGEKEVRLGGTFFFSRGGGDIASARRFATTIAAQLAEISPKLRSLIERAIESTPRLESLSVRGQWEKLVIEPLSELYCNTAGQVTPLLVIVDALDEGNGAEDVKILIDCLGEMTQVKGALCRVFMTSRPDQPIRVGLSGSGTSASRENFVLHDIERSIVDQDLGLYYRDQLAEMKAKMFLDDDLPSESTVDCLVERSHGLFIYAATVCRFVKGGSSLALERLERLLSSQRAASAEQELDKIYLTVLEYSFLSVTQHLDSVETEKVYQLFRRIVGSIIIAFDVLSLEKLALLLGEKAQRIRTALSALHSVIDVPDHHLKPIRILHPSFRDFLLNPARCVNNSYAVIAEEAHEVLATRCFDILLSQLRRNPLNQEKPGATVRDTPVDLVNKCITMTLRYSSRYWVEHTLKCGTNFRSDTLILRFLEKKYLFWLECLAWMGQMEQGIEAMSLLNIVFVEQPSKQGHLLSKRHDKPSPNDQNTAKSSTRAYIKDALRFLLSYNIIIAKTPLQVYLSALIFSPQASMIRTQNCNNLPRWMLNLPCTPEKWSNSPRSILISCPPRVYSVAVSPDSILVAMACGDSLVHIRSAVTGKEKFILKGNSGGYANVVFSPSGDYAASASNRAVSLWKLEVRSGETIPVLLPEFHFPFGDQSQQENFAGRLSCCTFSPDGTIIAGSNASRAVKVWGIKGERSLRFLFKVNQPVNKLLFSSDGSLLISISKCQSYQSVNLWDIDTGRQVESEVFIHETTPVIFLFGTKYLSSVPGDSLFHSQLVIRDIFSGSDYEIIIPGEAKDIPAIAVLKGSNLVPILAAIYPEKLVVWTPGKKQTPQLLECNEFAIQDAVFSPDGNLVVAFGDEYVQIFTLNPFEFESSASDTVYQSCAALASRLVNSFSRSLKEGRKIYRRSDDESVCVLSRDGSLLAIGWPGSSIGIWDTKTGKLRFSIKVFGYSRSLLFSANSQFCATFTMEKVKIWNMTDGSERDFPKGEASESGKFGFSPSGRRAIRIKTFPNSSRPDECLVWSIEDIQSISKFPLPDSNYRAPRVALSPNDDLYVTCTQNAMVVMEVKKLSDHQLQCRKVMAQGLYIDGFRFMPGDQNVLIRARDHNQGSSSPDHVVYIWNTIQNEVTQVTSSYKIDYQVSLSDDGRILAVFRPEFIDVYDVSSATFLRRFEPESEIREGTFRPLSETIFLTDQGAISLDDKPLPSGLRLSATTTWVQENGKNVVAIPAAYRDWKVFVNGRSVAFIKEGHDPLFLIFDEGMKSMW